MQETFYIKYNISGSALYWQKLLDMLLLFHIPSRRSFLYSLESYSQNEMDCIDTNFVTNHFFYSSYHLHLPTVASMHLDIIQGSR